MSKELLLALNQLENEKGISHQILLESIERALTMAYRKGHAEAEDVRVEIDQLSGYIRVFDNEKEVTPSDFGRIAAHYAKQVIIQSIRESEYDALYYECKQWRGTVLTGKVIGRTTRDEIIDLGKVRAMLPNNERIKKDNNARKKVYITDVLLTPKGVIIKASQTHYGLIRGLMQLEIPDVANGKVEVKRIARKPGYRAKVAVYSAVEVINPVAVCVGNQGKFSTILSKELSGEKVEIVLWDPDPATYISNAMQPIEVEKVILDHETHKAQIFVQPQFVSEAIGKGGATAELVSRLTQWNIDIVKTGN